MTGARVGVAWGGGGRLVERDTELAAVVDALAHPPAIVVVEGEPGVGKTRLVREALAARELSGRQMLEGEAHPVRDPYPLGPLVGALLNARLPPPRRLNPVTGALRALLPERADDLPAAPEPPHDRLSERHRTVRALVELLAALGPAVLVLEDLHWADDRTLEVLGMLAARPPQQLAVVVTYRGADAPSGSPLRAALADLPRDVVRAHLHLRPLSVGGVGALAAGLLGTGTVSEEFTAHLRDRSGGIPFVVEEDLRLLVEHGQVAQRGAVWVRRAIEELSVPPSVGDAVVERAARLSDPAQAALEAAAVAAVGADETLLAQISGLDPGDLASGLSEALGCGLLRERGAELVFRHALARQAIHDAIPGPRRRRLHLAAARALETTRGEAALGRVAHHYRAAGDAQAWARCAEAAADLAHRIGEDAVAYRYLRELLESGAALRGRRADITIKLGTAAFAVPSEAAATGALLERALALGGLPSAARGELRLLLGMRRFDDPEAADAAADDIRAAIDDLGDRPELQARALCMLAVPWGIRTGTLADHMGLLEAARVAAARSDDPVVKTAISADVAWALMQVGDPEAWPAVEALAAPDLSSVADLHVLRGLGNVAHAALDVGHYRRAIEAIASGQGLAMRLNPDRRYLTNLRAADLRARWLTGDVADVEADAEQLRGDEDTSVALDAELVLAEILLERGALAEAHQKLASSVSQRQERLARIPRHARASAGLVRIALARGRERDAAEVADHVLGLVASKQIWVWAAPLMPFAPMAVLRPLLPQYRAGIADRSAPLATAALAFLDARIAEDAGELDAAAEAYGRAREQCGTLPDPRLGAHAAAGMGRCRVRASHGAGEQLLRSAWQTFTELDASWEADRVKQLMRTAGLPVPHRRGRQGYGDQLSPREREVGQRAADGLTNREIAEELFLSPRTVEYHLANAMRKLGVSSRRCIHLVPTPRCARSTP